MRYFKQTNTTLKTNIDQLRVTHAALPAATEEIKSSVELSKERAVSILTRSLALPSHYTNEFLLYSGSCNWMAVHYHNIRSSGCDGLAKSISVVWICLGFIAVALQYLPILLCKGAKRIGRGSQGSSYELRGSRSIQMAVTDSNARSVFADIDKQHMANTKAARGATGRQQPPFKLPTSQFTQAPYAPSQ